MDVLNLSPGSRWAPDLFRLWFSPSGRQLLALTGHPGGANLLCTWDVAEGRIIARREMVNDLDHDNGFPFPDFDRTRRYVLFDDHVEDCETGRRITLEFMEFDRAISPDGRAVYALVSGGGVKRFNLSWDFEGESTDVSSVRDRALLPPEPYYAESLAVSPAGDLVVVRTSGGKQLRPYLTEEVRALPPVDLPVYETDGVKMMMEPYGRMAFAPDGRTLAVAGDGVCLVDPRGGGPARTLDERHFADLAFTPDGARIVGVRPDGAFVVWDAATGDPLTSLNLKAEAGPLKAVAVAPDGQTAVAGGTDGRMVRLDL